MKIQPNHELLHTSRFPDALSFLIYTTQSSLWYVQPQLHLLHSSQSNPANPLIQLDKLLGMAMLIVASSLFLYYTAWTLLMVTNPPHPSPNSLEQLSNTKTLQPFVDDDHPLQSLFPARVWAIRIPVILTLLGSAVVGSFLAMVMIRSNRKKAAKLRAQKKQ